MPVNHSYRNTEDEMQDRGRWTPVYLPNENNHNTTSNTSNKQNSQMKYMLPSDLLPTVNKQSYHPRGEDQRPHRSSRKSYHSPSAHRQRNSQISIIEDLPCQGTIDQYNLPNYVHISPSSSRQGPSKKKSSFKKYSSKIIASLLIILYIVYFVAVLLIPSQVEEEDYWCKGDGLLIVITAIGGYFLIYFQIVKPLFKKARKVISKPKSERVEIMPKKSCLNHWFIKLIGYLIFLGAVIAFVIYDTSNERRRLFSAVGILVLVGCGYVLSYARTKIIWVNIIWALAFQFGFGLIVLRWPPGVQFFNCFSGKVQTFLTSSDSGARFIYGDSLIDQGIFAFKAMSVVIFFSLCIQILYYYGIMQFLIMKIGWVLKITVGTTACESISAAGNMFLGQTEAPLLVKPYLDQMTNSELHAVMTGGFATISGSVMAAFISFGVSAPHLVTASVMNAPAALAMSKIYRPETEKSKAENKFFKIEKGDQTNALHAALDGVSAAIPLVANICANLLAFIAFMAFADGVLNWICLLINLDDGTCSLSNGFGYLFMPIAFVMGVPWSECYYVGQLIGTKVFINEFVAYIRLADFLDKSVLSKRAEVIVTFALCGFGNISSIGIQIGGLGSMAPKRKADIAKLAVKSLIAGCSASFLTASIAGILVSSPYQSLDEYGNFTLTNDTAMF